MNDPRTHPHQELPSVSQLLSSIRQLQKTNRVYEQMLSGIRDSRAPRGEPQTCLK